MPDDVKDGDEDGETTLIPASIFPDDCEVGDNYTVKVVHKYSDELEIKYVKKDKKSDDDDDSDSMDYKIDQAAMPEPAPMV